MQNGMYTTKDYSKFGDQRLRSYDLPELQLKVSKAVIAKHGLSLTTSEFMDNNVNKPFRKRFEVKNQPSRVKTAGKLDTIKEEELYNNDQFEKKVFLCGKYGNILPNTKYNFVQQKKSAENGCFSYPRFWMPKIAHSKNVITNSLLYHEVFIRSKGTIRKSQLADLLQNFRRRLNVVKQR